MAKNISCADTAKLVRQALREAFPGVKFSVRSSTYSMGASMSVKWVDGPNTKQVESITDKFSGSYFDGMQDLKGSTYAMFGGEVVHFGADSIHCTRSYSDASTQRAIDRFYAKYLGNFNQYGIAKPTVEEFNSGRLYNVQIMNQGVPYDRNVQRGIWEMLSKHSDRLKVEESKTAGAVIYLGNDGHSQCGALREEALA